MTLFNSVLADAATVVPQILMMDFLRYAIGAGGMFLVINIVLSRWLGGRRIRDRAIRGAQIRRELLTSLRTVVIFASVGFSIWLSERLGFPLFDSDPARHGWVWFWMSIPLLIVLHDAWFYWTHRLIHDPRLFRRWHRTHHLSQNPTPFTAYAFDSGEAFVNAIFFFLAGLLLPVSYLAGFVFLVHMMLRNAVGHCGYEVFPRTRDGRPLFGWMTTVTHHDLHHAQAGWNYGLYFTHWDRWMGTENPDYLAAFARAVGKPGAQTRKPGQVIRAGLLAGAMLLATRVALPDRAAHAQERPVAEAMADIEGLWATQGYGAIVRMHACAGDPSELCGTLVWAWDPAEIKPGAIGMLMLSGGAFSDGEWRKGRLTDPATGRVYSGKIRQDSPNMLDLEGCALVFCQSQVWRRLESLPHVTGKV